MSRMKAPRTDDVIILPDQSGASGLTVEKVRLAHGALSAQVERHSPLGGSAAERFVECSGSVALYDLFRSQGLMPSEADEPEWTTEGKLAHALGAFCLDNPFDAWEGLAMFPGSTSEMADAVQVYLDDARNSAFSAEADGLDVRRFVEFEIEHPAFHPLMFSRLDLADIHVLKGVPVAVIIDDYKHGIGVPVEIDGNYQLQYYAFAFIDGLHWPADLPRLLDDAPVTMKITQPRVTWMDPVRSWTTTAGEIRAWAYQVLYPAMKKAGELDFKLGSWCHFCKVQLACPKMRKGVADLDFIAVEQKGNDFDLPNMSDEWLADQYGRDETRKFVMKTIRDEVSKRVLAGRTISTAKLVNGLVDREWKPGAASALSETWQNEEAWIPAKLKSPAQIEGMPGGKDFVEEWAQKPKAPLVVAPLSDKRKAQKFVGTAEKFSIPVDTSINGALKLVDTPADSW